MRLIDKKPFSMHGLSFIPLDNKECSKDVWPFANFTEWKIVKNGQSLGVFVVTQDKTRKQIFDNFSYMAEPDYYEDDQD